MRSVLALALLLVVGPAHAHHCQKIADPVTISDEGLLYAAAKVCPFDLAFKPTAEQKLHVEFLEGVDDWNTFRVFMKKNGTNPCQWALSHTDGTACKLVIKPGQ